MILKHSLQKCVCAYRNNVVFSIKISSGIVVVEIVCFEAWQSINVILQPLPYITIHIIESQGVGWKHVHWLHTQGRKFCLTYSHGTLTTYRG